MKKNRLLPLRACFVGWRCLLAVLAVGSTSAFATPVLNGTHYQETLSVLCGNLSSCSLPFTAVPAGKDLLVVKVTCTVVYVGATVDITYMLLGRRQNTSRAGPTSHLIPVLLSSNASTRIYTISNDTFHMFSAGQMPLIYTAAVLGKANNMECTLFGALSATAG